MVRRQPALAIESSASIRVFGLNLDFASLSRAIDAEPSVTHRAGDRGPTSRPYSTDLWCLDSPLPRSDPLGAHLLWLSKRLGPYYSFLRGLKQTAEVRSFCGIIADGAECNLRLSPAAFRLFTDLDVQMELSLIFGAEDLPRPSLRDREELPQGGPTGPYRTESQVHLVARGHDLDGGPISPGLGIQSLRISPRGEIEAAAEVGDSWSLLVPVGRQDKLDQHLRWLGSFLSRHADFIRSQSKGRELAIHCAFETSSEMGGVDISSEALRLPVELGLVLSIDVRLLRGGWPTFGGVG